MPSPSPSRLFAGKPRWLQEKGWLLCGAKGWASSPLSWTWKPPSTRAWLQALLLAPPRAGLELARVPAPPRAPAPQSYGRARCGPRLLSRVQLTQGLAKHHTPAAQASPNLCAARQPDLPFQAVCPRALPQRSLGLAFTCLPALMGCGLLEGMFY